MAPTDPCGPRRFDRPAMLHELADRRFDVLVVGAGLAGSAAALDAAARGLRTALVDAGDFGAGASSHTTKLIHGGLRHLRRGDLRLVATSFAERRRLLANAAHLVEPLPFVMPYALRRDGVSARFVRAVDTMLRAYDLAEGRLHGDHRRVDAAELDSLLGVISGADGGFVLSNGVVDDARLVLALARTACLDHGATVANHARVVGLHHAPSGLVRGARIRTREGDTIDVSARAVVNAAGVDAGDVGGLDDPDAHAPTRRVRVTHVALPSELLPIDAATVLAGDAPVVLVPWGPVVLAGPLAAREHPDRPGASADDIDRLLATVRAQTTVDAGPDDVTSVTTGFRPSVRPRRRHAVTTTRSGLVSVSGATLTSFRLLAADAVDAVLDQFADDLDRWVVRRCRTAELPLRGAAGHGDVPVPRSVDGVVAERLVRRHGGEAGALLAMAERGSSPLVSGLPHLDVEATWAARHEMALTVGDVLERRVRARMVDSAATAAAAERTASLMAAELGWSARRATSEAAAFCDELAQADDPLEALGA